MTILKQTGWYAYAALATILTIGGFLRFHLVTVRIRKIGGVRAGTYGGTHVYREKGSLSLTDYLVISKWHGKGRYPVRKIAYAQTGITNVRVESSGGQVTKLRTWQTRTVAAYINNQVAG
jgi:hypothetical protein